MPSLSTLPKGDSAWLLRKSIERIMQQVSVLETNIGSSTTGNSSNGQVIFNDNGTLRGDADMTFNTALNRLIVSSLEVSTTATITGNLTVQTNKLFVSATGAAVGTTSLFADFQVQRSTNARLEIDSSATGISYQILDNARTGYLQNVTIASQHLWFNGASEAMRLNSTGLGVGVSPAATIHAYGSGSSTAAVRLQAASGRVFDVGSTGSGYGAANNFIIYDVTGAAERLRIDSSGNVGIGVTPSATNSTYFQALEIARVGQGLTTAKNVLTGSPRLWLSNNSYATYSSGVDWNYAISQPAAQYLLFEGQHQWYTAPSGTAGNAITFTERLRLKDTGQLRFVPLASDPAGAEAGDVYYNSSSNKLKCYNGTTWNDLF